MEQAGVEQIVERLKKEKAELEESYYQQGKEEGLSFARDARYEELTCIVMAYHSENGYIHPGILECMPLGIDTYWIDVITDDPLLNGANFGFMQDVFREGWVKAIVEFWEGIKDQLH